MYYLKSNEQFVVFSNTVLCEEETNMALASMIPYKIGYMPSKSL